MSNNAADLAGSSLNEQGIVITITSDSHSR